ncbi:MAG: arylsulfatase [Pontiellaceae bacterium]
MKFIFYLLLSILFYSLSFASTPNIILIISDDQGYGDFGFSGNKQIQTPFLDHLAKNSILLTNFHVDPTCAPTRAALLTGRYSNRAGVWHTVQGRNMLREREITLADILKDNGYRTGLFGKWHLGDNYPYRPIDRGFNHYVMHHAGGVGQAPDYWGNDYFDDTYNDNGNYKKFNGFCTDIWFEEAIKFIQSNKNKPFFAYIAPNAPHSPFYCPSKYSELYEKNNKIPNIPFYGMITNIDDNMGNLMEFLDRENLSDNTILIYMTDNGTSAGMKNDIGFNANMRGKKNSEYEGGHRVPCMIRWPKSGLKHGREISQLTAHIDILPTILDWCNLKTPDINFDGKSITTLLQDIHGAWPDRTIVVESQRVVNPIKWRKSAVMKGPWRLINGKELYNLDTDFGQQKNIANKHPSMVSQLRNDYEVFWDDVSQEHVLTSHIVLGSDSYPTVKLSSHDWLIDQLSPWSQDHVKNGFCEESSFWSIECRKAGTYEISLRRWPVEADKAINDGTYGKSYKYTHAKLRINDLDIKKSIPLGAKEVTFSVHLPKGIMKLAPVFISEDLIATPYYAYVTHQPKKSWQTPKGMNVPIYDPNYGEKPPQITN